MIRSMERATRKLARKSIGSNPLDSRRSRPDPCLILAFLVGDGEKEQKSTALLYFDLLF